jgi:hypothetical protein
MTAKKIPAKEVVTKRVRKIKYPSLPEVKEIKKIDLEFVKEDRNITSVTYDISSKTIKQAFDKIRGWFNKESQKTHKEKYGFNLWEIYSNWFNETFNKKPVINKTPDKDMEEFL